MRVRHGDKINEGALDASTVLLTVRGRVDRALALDLQRAIGAAVRGGRVRAILDFTGADAVEPGVVAALLHARRRLLSMGGELTVVATTDPFGAASPLPIAASLAAARAVPPFNVTRQAVVEVVGPVRRALTRWSHAAGADARALEAIALASSEAITNVVVHAYRDHPEPGLLNVAGEVAGDQVRVTVCDEGCGMVPRMDSPGLGLGLPLISQLTASLEIESQPAEGTRLAMLFALAGPVSRAA